MDINSREKILERRKEYYLNNREKILEQQKEYYLNNKEKLIPLMRLYKEKNKKKLILKQKEYYLNNKEKVKENLKKYREKNKEKIKIYKKTYRKSASKEQWFKDQRNNYLRDKYYNDSNYKIRVTLRTRISHVLKGRKKSKPTLKLLGCTVEQLWVHLEKQFQPWMTRANHGTWHVDHIRPCASFDLTDPKQQAECFHYTNLQPLWAHQNISKGAKYDATL